MALLKRERIATHSFLIPTQKIYTSSAKWRI
jgi:hypothetical protein